MQIFLGNILAIVLIVVFVALLLVGFVWSFLRWSAITIWKKLAKPAK